MQTYRCEHPEICTEYGDYRLRVKMIEDHHKLGGRAGEHTITSRLKSIDFDRGIAITQNSIYIWEVSK